MSDLKNKDYNYFDVHTYYFQLQKRLEISPEVEDIHGPRRYDVNEQISILPDIVEMIHSIPLGTAKDFPEYLIGFSDKKKYSVSDPKEITYEMHLYDKWTGPLVELNYYPGKSQSIKFSVWKNKVVKRVTYLSVEEAKNSIIDDAYEGYKIATGRDIRSEYTWKSVDEFVNANKDKKVLIFNDDEVEDSADVSVVTHANYFKLLDELENLNEIFLNPPEDVAKLALRDIGREIHKVGDSSYEFCEKGEDEDDDTSWHTANYVSLLDIADNLKNFEKSLI